MYHDSLLLEKLLFNFVEVQRYGFLVKISILIFLIDISVLGILVLSGIILLPVLLPVAATDDSIRAAAKSTTSIGTFNDLDKLSMGNITVSYTTHHEH